MRQAYPMQHEWSPGPLIISKYPGSEFKIFCRMPRKTASFLSDFWPNVKFEGEFWGVSIFDQNMFDEIFDFSNILVIF